MLLKVPSNVDFRGAAERAWERISAAVFRDRVAAAFKGPGLDAAATKANIERVSEILLERKVVPGSPRFDEEVFRALSQARRSERFDQLFSDGLTDDFRENAREMLRGSSRRSAEEFLTDLGIEPSSSTDKDWARIALAMRGSRRGEPVFTALTGLQDGIDRDLPDFETDRTIRINAERIEKIGDLYYVHIFDRLGVFRVVDEISTRFFDQLDLGSSDIGERLFNYIRGRPLRFPDADRRRIAEMLFEGAGGRGQFKPLLARMIESMIEFARIRSAGELLTNPDLRQPNVFARSAVKRSVENLQRFLSDTGGGIIQFIARDSKQQMLAAFDILEAEEILQYFGGSFRKGMLTVIDETIYKLDGEYPPTDRMRTLAVSGRRIFKWLASTANRASSLSDDEIMEGIDIVQDWLAAYRKPSVEPEWLGDTDLDAEAEDEDDPARKAVREAVRRSGADIDAEDILEAR